MEKRNSKSDTQLTEPISETSEARETSKVPPTSPKWSNVTKIIVGLILVVIAGFLVVRFNQYLSMLLLAILLSILLHPIARFINTRLKISWGVAVLIVYLAVAALILFLIARGGTSLYTQIETLVNNLQTDVSAVTEFLQKYSNREIVIGPLHFQTPSLSTQFITSQITERIQPILGQAGTVAAKVIGWLGTFLFNFVIVFMVSLFLSSESEGAKNRMVVFKLPGYEADQKRMGKEISNIFDSFVRGEFTIVGVAILIYTGWLGIMGLPYFIICALIAGFGRFIPYIGAWLGWISFIIASFLRTPPWGLTPLAYTGIILAVALVVDTLLDHWLTPKIMGQALEVHPAAILLTALIGAQLFGLLGIILAAPFFASAKLLLTYLINKLTDRDPWEGISYFKPRKKPVIMKWMQVVAKKVKSWWKSVREWLKLTATKLLAKRQQ
ncbi:MAG: AI-2E family transporter [Anaerolineaceae bacterium]